MATRKGPGSQKPPAQPKPSRQDKTQDNSPAVSASLAKTRAAKKAQKGGLQPAREDSPDWLDQMQAQREETARQIAKRNEKKAPRKKLLDVLTAGSPHSSLSSLTDRSPTPFGHHLSGTSIPQASPAKPGTLAKKKERKATPVKDKDDEAEEENQGSGTKAKKLPEWKVPGCGWGVDPDPAHSTIMVGKAEAKVWTTADGVMLESTIPKNERPVFTKWNMTADHWNDSTWIPPPGVRLDETALFTTTMLTMDNRNSRHIFYGVHFRDNGHLRTNRTPIGKAPHVIAVHDWINADNQHMYTVIGRFYLVYKRRERLGGEASPATAVPKISAKDAQTLWEEEDGKYGLWTWGSEEVKEWAEDDYFIMINQYGSVLPFQSSIWVNEAEQKTSKPILKCTSDLVSLKMKFGPEIDQAPAAGYDPNDCTGTAHASHVAQQLATLSRTTLDTNWARDISPQPDERFVEILADSVYRRDQRMKEGTIAGQKEKGNSLEARRAADDIQAGNSAEKLLTRIRSSINPDSVYQKLKRGHYDPSKFRDRLRADTRQHTEKQAQSGQVEVVSSSKPIIKSSDSLKNLLSDTVLELTSLKRKAAAVDDIEIPKTKVPRDESVVLSVEQTAKAPTKSYMGKIIYNSMITTVKELSAKQEMEAAEITFLRNGRAYLDAEITRMTADLTRKYAELDHMSLLIGEKMSDQAYYTEETRLAANINQLRDANLPVLADRLEADAAPLIEAAKNFVLPDRREGRDHSPGLLARPWAEEEDDEKEEESAEADEDQKDEMPGQDQEIPTTVSDKGEYYGDMSL